MTETALESVLRRDRSFVLAAVAAMTLLAWGYVLWLASGTGMATSLSTEMPGMPGMTMPAISGPGDVSGALSPRLAPWSSGDAAFMVAMWTVMMVGMMTPSAAPMILIYARVGRQAAVDGKPFASSAWFASGYLAAWIGFALLATGAQWALESRALLTPIMAGASPLFGALVLISAGLYQWTSLKDACLSQCQSPLVFIQRHGGFRRKAREALFIGLKHGAYCVGCCWALMALLFVGGVMNVLWIAAIAIFVLAEKIAPGGRAISRMAGIGLIGAGILMLAQFVRLS